MSTHPVLLCLRTRRVGLALMALVVLGVVIGLALTADYAIAGRGNSLTPLVRLAPIVLGAVVGIVTGSIAPDVERLGGRRLVAVVGIQTLGLSLAAAGIAAGSVYVALPFIGAQPDGATATVSLVLVRATFAFCGLALISAALLGNFYAWVLPILSVPVVTLFGSTTSGIAHGWNPVNAPADGLLAWTVSMVLLIAGAVLVALATTGRPLLSRI